MVNPYTDWVNPMTGKPYYGKFGQSAFQQEKKPKSDWLQDTIKPVIEKANNLEAVENERGAKTEKFLTSELDKASQPTLSDEDVARMFTGKSDEAARTQLDQEAGLRDMLGANGITGGGYAQGLLTGFEGQRWGTVTDARRSLAITQATTAADDRYKRFVNSQAVATQMNRPPSTIGLEAARYGADSMLAKYGIDKSAKAAKKSAKGAETGGIIGGLGSAVGGLAL